MSLCRYGQNMCKMSKFISKCNDWANWSLHWNIIVLSMLHSFYPTMKHFTPIAMQLNVFICQCNVFFYLSIQYFLLFVIAMFYFICQCNVLFYLSIQCFILFVHAIFSFTNSAQLVVLGTQYMVWLLRIYH